MEEAHVADLLKKNPALTPHREKLLTLKKGTYCLHRTWGVGHIQGYDEASGKLTIDFEGQKEGHQMDPAFCVTKLEVLPPTHIIARHRSSPAEIQALIDTNPGELFVQILSAAPGHTISALEMENILLHLLGPDYKKWLTSAKKRIAKDTRIGLPEKKTDAYQLHTEPVAADDEVLVSFYKTKNVKKKIELAETLLAHQPIAEEVKSKLPSLVEELATAINDSRVLTPGEKLQGAWVRDDLAAVAGITTEAISVFKPAPADLLGAAFSLAELSEQLPAVYLRRFLDLVKASRTNDWQKVSLDLLKNSSGKFTQECITFLLDNDAGKLLSDTLEKWLGEQTLKAPILTWAIKNRGGRRYSTMLSRMMSPKFFSAILYAIDYEAIQNATQKRIQLVDLLVEDKDLIPELLATATPEVARDLAHTLMINQGFESLTKRSLIARFIKQFPEIQAVIASDAQTTQQEGLVVSWESLERRKEEYQLLVTKKIPENKQAIATARELGDLKENSEYKMARQDQETLMALKGQMETELRIARGTDFADTRTDSVGIGSIVEVQPAGGSATTYTILGAWDGNPDKNILSYKTPLAQQLMGKKVGDTLKTSLGGQAQEWRILSVKRYIDTLAKA